MPRTNPELEDAAGRSAGPAAVTPHTPPATRTKARRRRVPVVPLIAAVAVTSVGGAAFAASSGNRSLGQNLVGRQRNGSVLTAQNQFITPAGRSIEQTGQPMDLEVSPDGRTAVTLTKSGQGLFTVVDLASRKVLQQYTPPKGTGTGDVSVGGLLYSKDGRTLWAAQTGDILRFAVAADGTLSAPTVIAIPSTGPEKTPTSADGTPAKPLPSDLAWSPDGTHILVVLDGYDRLAVLDPATDVVRATTSVGIAPRDVAVIGNHAFVSNEGGRRPTDTDFTNLSYDSRVVAEPVDGRASTGSVSEVDLATGAVVKSYKVGLDPSSMAVHGTDLLVTNSSDDTISVIDTAAHQVTQTVNVNPLPGQPYGASPNALAFLDDTHLAVSLGRDNAIAVYEYAGARTAVAFSGLVPTGWYPGKLVWNKALGQLVIANLKGVGALAGDNTISEGPGTKPATGKQVYKDLGTIQQMGIPSTSQIARYTSSVFANNQWHGLAARNPRGSAATAATAMPLRTGDPSKIKHVFVIVRENRTYDQVLGDLPRGNGDPRLTQFGMQVTPNSHALATQFPLIDNLYSNGTNSATGHTWLDAAFVNDYLERSYANYVRNYGQPDAMVYPKSGFLWDNALAHGRSARIWGEYAAYYNAPDASPAQGTWTQWYRDAQILEGKAKGGLHAPVGYFQSKSDMPSLDRILAKDYPNFQLQITDQYRADLFIKDLKAYEKQGAMPALNMLWVMEDHTGGSRPGLPTPSAMVADNDLATGRIVDAISHSKFWKDSAVFTIEDDSQNGVDHVDGHRNVVMVASPYARRGSIDHTYYTQLNVTRSVEQILGLPPMNQLDLAAEPMRAVFTDKPDFTPYTAKPNRIPLTTLNPQPSPSMSSTQRQWVAWSKQQDFTRPDAPQLETFNRLTWYQTTGWARPYPGDATVMTPDQVRKAFPPSLAADDEKLPVSLAQRPHTASSAAR